MSFQNTFKGNVGQIIQTTGTVTVGGVTITQSSDLGAHTQALQALASEIEKTETIPTQTRTAAAKELLAAKVAIEKSEGSESIKRYFDRAQELLKGSAGLVAGATSLATKIGDIWGLLSPLI